MGVRSTDAAEDWRIASRGQPVFLTRLRTSLLVGALDVDLQLQASVATPFVSNRFQATRTIGTSPEVMCANTVSGDLSVPDPEH